jgi:hypothetical protein
MKELERTKEILKELGIEADEIQTLNFALVYTMAQREQLKENLARLEGKK